MKYLGGGGGGGGGKNLGYPVVSSNEVNVLRYCTRILFLRSQHVTK